MLGLCKVTVSTPGGGGAPVGMKDMKPPTDAPTGGKAATSVAVPPEYTDLAKTQQLFGDPAMPVFSPAKLPASAVHPGNF